MRETPLSSQWRFALAPPHPVFVECERLESHNGYQYTRSKRQRSIAAVGTDMQWLAPFRNKLVLGGAVVAGTAGIAVGCAMSGAAVTAWSVLGGAVGVAMNMLSNWASEDLRPPLPVDSKIRLDIKRGLAQALSRCLTDDATQPGSLISRLSAPELDLRYTADLIAYWKRHVDSALDAQDSAALDQLFPGVDADQGLIDLMTAQQPDALWLAVYRDTLGRWSGDSYLVTLCGGVERLERQVPAALAATLPAQFAEVLKDGDSRRSWIAFQKTMLAEVRTELQAHGAAVAEQRDTIDALLARFDDVCEEQRRQLERLNVRFDRIDDSVRAVGDIVIHNTRLLNELRTMLRAQHDPPLYIPEVEEQTPLGVRALRFSERLCATIGRDDELQRLDAFLDAKAPLLWWGIVGAAGMGKSHLGLHLVEQRARSGWHTGFLETDTQWIGDEQHLRHWQPRAPTLIVVDYASARAPRLLTLITQLYERRAVLGHRVRLLLLDRPGALAPAFAENVHLQTAAEDSWNRAQRCLYSTDNAARKIQDPLDALGSAARVNRLGDDRLLSLQSLERSHWRPLLQKAIRYFRQVVELPDDDHALWQQLAQISDAGRPLLLLVAAGVLAAAHRDGRPLSLDQSSRDHLIHGIIERDRSSVWADAAGIARDEWKSKHRIDFERGIAFVTLLGGLVWSDVAQRTALAMIMGRTIGSGSPLRHELAAILGWNDRERALSPLEPDLFGEHLLVGGAQDCYDSEALFSVRELVNSAFELRPLRCAEIIGRIARDFPKYGSIWIGAGFEAAALTRPIAQPTGPDFEKVLDDEFVMAAQTLVEAVGHSIERHAYWPNDIDKALHQVATHDPRYALGIQSGLSRLLRAMNDDVADQVLARAEMIGSGTSRETVFAYASFLSNAVREFSARADALRMKLVLAKLSTIAPVDENADAEPWRYAALGPWIFAALIATVDFAKEGDASAAKYYARAIVAAIDLGSIESWSQQFTATANAICALILHKENIGLEDVNVWVDRLSQVAAICIESIDWQGALACLNAFYAIALQSIEDPGRTCRYACEMEKLLAFASIRAVPDQVSSLARCACVAVLSTPRDNGADRRALLALLRHFVGRSLEFPSHLTNEQLSGILARAIEAFCYARDLESIERLARLLAQFQDMCTIDSAETLEMTTIAMQCLVCAYDEIDAPDLVVAWVHRLSMLGAVTDAYDGTQWTTYGIRSLGTLLPLLIRHERTSEVVCWLRRLGGWLRVPAYSDGDVQVQAMNCLETTLHYFGENPGPRRVREAVEAVVGNDASFLTRMPDEARMIFARCALRVVTESAESEHDQVQHWCKIVLAIVPSVEEGAALKMDAVMQAMASSMCAGRWRTLVEWVPWMRDAYTTEGPSDTLTAITSWACWFTAIAARDGNEVATLAAIYWAALFDDIEARVEVVPADAAFPLMQSLCLAFESFEMCSDFAATGDAEWRARRIIAKLTGPLSTNVLPDLAKVVLRAVRRTRDDAAAWSALVSPHLCEYDWPEDDADRSTLADLAAIMIEAANSANDRVLLDTWQPVSARFQLTRNEDAVSE